MGHGWDAEPARCHDPLLQPGQCADARGHGYWPGAVHPGHLTDAGLDQLVEAGQFGAELVLHWRDPVAMGGGAHPDAAQLGELFRQRHPAEQVRDPLLDGAARIAPRLGHFGRGNGLCHCRTLAVDSRTMSLVDSSTRVELSTKLIVRESTAR